MSFTENMRNELLENYNESVTENGAVGYRTTGKYLLDINFAVASLRSATEQEIIESFKKAFFEDKVLAVKWLFFARDVRGGLGERRLFRTAMKFIAEYEPETAAKVIPLVAEYGRFDDMWEFLDNETLRPVVLNYIDSQLKNDIDDKNNQKPISLLAKWLPSVNSSSDRTKVYANIIRKHLGMTERDYRKLLAELRMYLDVVERKMSAKQWGDIKYEAVPSCANLIYNNAFMRNDGERRQEYLSKLEKGETKIHASVLYPHDIVHRYKQYNYGMGRYSLKQYDQALEALWKALPDMVQGNGDTIVVADGSGSMGIRVGNTDVTALDVANALAIYFAERSSGGFKNKYITFSSRPQLVNLDTGKTLRDKISIAIAHNEITNTNVEAVFDLVLSTAIQNKMTQNDIPANVLIISDMEFDTAVCSYCSSCGIDANLFNVIEQKYAQAGYKLPRLVFWNVNSRTGTVPVRQNKLGVALVSGFSVNICNMVMSGEIDPYKCLLDTINSERYKPVEDLLIA